MKKNPPSANATVSDAPTSEDLSGLHIWLILWKAYRSVEGHALASITRLSLGLSDFAVLEVLFHKGPQPVNNIGKKILLTSGSITTAIDRLEAKGFVRRAASQEDRRVRLVELTTDGKNLIQCALSQHKEDMEQAAAALSPSERRQIIQLLKKLGLSTSKSTAETIG